jgi:CBS domain containing-hemolysin-like protein
MTPRVRTISLETTDRAVEVLDAARTSGQSRYPVLDHDDNVFATVQDQHAVALPPS